MYGKRMPPFLLFLQVQRLSADTSPYSQASRVINFCAFFASSLPLSFWLPRIWGSVRDATGSEMKAIGQLSHRQ